MRKRYPKRMIRFNVRNVPFGYFLYNRKLLFLLYKKPPAGCALARIRKNVRGECIILFTWSNEQKSFEPAIFIYPEKDLPKGTSEAPVLSESERERRSKGIFLWGEGKRKRFPG